MTGEAGGLQVAIFSFGMYVSIKGYLEGQHRDEPNPFAHYESPVPKCPTCGVRLES